MQWAGRQCWAASACISHCGGSTLQPALAAAPASNCIRTDQSWSDRRMRPGATAGVWSGRTGCCSCQLGPEFDPAPHRPSIGGEHPSDTAFSRRRSCRRYWQRQVIESAAGPPFGQASTSAFSPDSRQAQMLVHTGLAALSSILLNAR